MLGAWLLGMGAVHAGQHWVGVGSRVTEWQEGVPADRVRLGVRDEGVYRVTAGEIARAAGVRLDETLAALGACGLSLNCRGGAVAWATDGDALYFYGQATEELFAPENVYWLSFGPGVAMAARDAVPEPGFQTNAWFLCTEHYRSSFLAPFEPRDRRSTHATLTNVLNFGEWVPASADETTRAQSRTLVMTGFSADAATGVTVRVELASYRDFVSPDIHACEILVNGVSCGVQSWSNEQAVVFDYAVPSGTVTHEALVLTVRNAGGTTTPSDFMVLDAILVYPRRYEAAEGLLLCAGGAAPVIAAGGFGSGRLGVWDVADAGMPVKLEASVAQDVEGGWQAVFECGDDAARYAVFDAAEGCFEPSVSGVRDIAWQDADEMPELAIVVPPRRWVTGFAEAVQPLADFRNAQGLRTRVVDAEALYNAFNDGIVHPEAFRRFCAAGVTNGSSPTLRYLLFAGHGGSDYKLEVFRLGEIAPYPSLFPLYLVSQVDASAPGAILLPNDPVLGDVTGGAVPEVAVGRFLATNAVELAHMVNKTIRYELTETWKRKAVFSADWENEGAMYANFAGIAAATASKFPSLGWYLEEFYPASDQSYLGSLWKNTYYHTGIYYELQEGAGFFYYVGHSSDTVAGNSSANKLFDAPMFRAGTWPFAPVAVLMGCRMGRWTLLDLMKEQQSIAEAGVRNRFSGFTAVVSSAGYMTTPEAIAFSHAFRDRVAEGALRLGDVWCGAFASMGDDASAQLRHMVLLGDPSLCLRVDRTARGTPASALAGLGLTGDPYADLKDQDRDGFVTWVELQAGTSPLQGGLRVRELSLPMPVAGRAPLAVVPGSGSAGLKLVFEPLAGLTYRVLSTVDLSGGEWQEVPWRTAADAEWGWSAIEGDWPVKSLEVPYEVGTRQRFYKVRAE